MTVDRPTFSESWHRMAGLCPRLRAAVGTSRQRFRGETWHVVQDPASNQFFRLNEPAYRFVGLLDGRRSVAAAWKVCQERFGDDAPTQGEAIQLLGDLHTANLLQAELPPEAEALFKRRRKRVHREVRSWLSNILFIRIPFFDPDLLLARWLPLVGWLFTRLGLCLWLLVVLFGAYQLIGHEKALASGLAGVLAPENLVWLYLCYAGVKACHELAHAFACKKFGRDQGGEGAGEVHAIGVMFLVFLPVPYVDASSSWALKSKAARIIVAAAGMMAELAIAGVAALVWSRTSEGSGVHALAYNVIFIAGVSTLLFNGNPLLRYDGYFILSDLLEIPNLGQRATDQLRYLVKKYAWGVKRARGPAETLREAAWLVLYGVGSWTYRLILYSGIILYVAGRLFLIGVILALVALIAWVVVPVARFVRYLAANPELSRVRARAVVSVLGGAALVAAALGLVAVPDHVRAEGVAQPTEFAVIHAGTDGFVTAVLPSGTQAESGSPILMTLTNPELPARRDATLAEIRRIEAQRRLALARDAAQVQPLQDQLDALTQLLRQTEADLAALRVTAPSAGVWICPQEDRSVGRHVKRGETLGYVARLDEVVIRAAVAQPLAALVIDEGREGVALRAKQRPEDLLAGRVLQVIPAGQERLPAASLGFLAGGAIETEPRDEKATTTKEPFFEARIAVEERDRLLPGQRVVARFRLRDKPLLAQGWRAVRQLLQKRFRI